MSADNWAVCPKCVANEEKRLRSVLDSAVKLRDESYGKVPVVAFNEIHARAMEAERNLDALSDRLEEFRTFREDYEIWGAEECAVQVGYSGGCSKCRLSLEFTHKHEVTW